MPFNPALPVTGSEITSAELRNQFTGLKDLIDAIPAPAVEADPVFAASEAALLMPGDKAKLDNAVQIGSGVNQLANDAQFVPTGSPVSFFANDANYAPQSFVTGQGYITGAYAPANAGHWDSTPPATLAEAIDRLAAVVSNNGATPIP